MTVPFSELRKKWRKAPDYRKEYGALVPEFRLARELIEARVKAGLTQEDVARRMGCKVGSPPSPSCEDPAAGRYR